MHHLSCIKNPVTQISKCNDPVKEYQWWIYFSFWFFSMKWACFIWRRMRKESFKYMDVITFIKIWLNRLYPVGSTLYLSKVSSHVFLMGNLLPIKPVFSHWYTEVDVLYFFIMLGLLGRAAHYSVNCPCPLQKAPPRSYQEVMDKGEL